MSLYGLVGVVALGGIATALQAHFMGILDKRIGTLESVFITYFGGGLLIGVIMLIQRGGHLGSGAVAPWYAYTSGILGLVIVGTLAYSTPRLGLVAAFTVFVAAQFLMGCVGRSLRLDGRRGAALESGAPGWDGAAVGRDMADHEELTRSDVHA